MSVHYLIDVKAVASGRKPGRVISVRRRDTLQSSADPRTTRTTRMMKIRKAKTISKELAVTLTKNSFQTLLDLQSNQWKKAKQQNRRSIGLRKKNPTPGSQDTARLKRLSVVTLLVVTTHSLY